MMKIKAAIARRWSHTMYTSYDFMQRKNSCYGTYCEQVWKSLSWLPWWTIAHTAWLSAE